MAAEAQGAGSRDSTQWVIFTLGNEEYAVKATQVQEISRLVEVTHVPGMPAFIKGVINLRGKIVPLFDLKDRFQIDPDKNTSAASTRVIVSLMGDQLIGLIVDSVSGVIRLSAGDVEALPPTLPKVDADYLLGVGKVGPRLIVLLNLERMLSDFEKGLLRDAKPAEPA